MAKTILLKTILRAHVQVLKYFRFYSNKDVVGDLSAKYIVVIITFLLHKLNKFVIFVFSNFEPCVVHSQIWVNMLYRPHVHRNSVERKVLQDVHLNRFHVQAEEVDVVDADCL